MTTFGAYGVGNFIEIDTFSGIGTFPDGLKSEHYENCEHFYDGMIVKNHKKSFQLFNKLFLL